ncbi:hypothetical protein [Nocardiopsis sp. MG754419]|uniref:hypothetical protein n=1 Tax=Nocardiopsis sp. MG754419 TaxID=2259865 RepID=UPI001BAB2620|nr:hypothetical protein [Nocardiopsis sp. MG754419]MBR8744987.1 hypothetical protein [Nocardiopsis sp. MG754419]
MAWFGRDVPDAIRSRLERGERVLAHVPVAAPAGTGPAPEGRPPVLAATTRALYLPDGHPVPWQDIDQAKWSADELRFVEEGHGERAVRLRTELTGGAVDYRRMAETVAERVTSTILVNRFVPFPTPDSTEGFRLVARRPPLGNEIDWRVHLGEGLDPEDPRLSDAVSRALALVREQMGV